MTTFDDSEQQQWASLCDQLDEALKEIDAAWSVVTAKFVAIGEGRSHDVPSAEELARLEDARARRDAVERQMNEFMSTRR